MLPSGYLTLLWNMAHLYIDDFPSYEPPFIMDFPWLHMLNNRRVYLVLFIIWIGSQVCLRILICLIEAMWWFKRIAARKWD